MKKSIFDIMTEAKDLPVVVNTDDVIQNGKKVSNKVDKMAGKDADSNGSRGLWEVDAPTDDDLLEDLDMENADANKKRLVLKFKTKRPFFIQGRAGWGKTSIITKLAKRFNRSVITVYLDKAEASDLDGIKIPREDKDGKAYMDITFPAWAQFMYEHPERQFLLFFDEMNQAPNDVLHALMPIILRNVICGYKFNNFIVGAAGNLAGIEDETLEELPPAVASRFKPIITWETNTDATWASAFKAIHKDWDKKVGKEFIDAVDSVHLLFANPREVELNIISYAYELIQDGDNEWMTADDFEDQIRGLLAEEIEGVSHYNESQQKVAIAQLASCMENFVKSGGKNLDSTKTVGRMQKREDNGTIDEATMEDIKEFLAQGWYKSNLDKSKHGVSLENISQALADATGVSITAQQCIWLKDNIQKLGCIVRYKTNEDFLKAGLPQ